ncbi:MAG: PAS domain-containing protein [Magnetococcales bacterium]|nr:PAS domain-containing protein [Magnetococcales bacterium]
MMRGRTRFWGALAVALTVALAGPGLVVWRMAETMPALDETVTEWLKQSLAMGMLALFCLVAVLAQLWAWLDRGVWKPLARLDRELEIMAGQDPPPFGEPEADHLLDALPENARRLAEALMHARRQVKEALTGGNEAMEHLENVIRHLNVGLVVIRADGDIVLYNPAAQMRFRQRQESLGLGRSLYDLCTRAPLETSMAFLQRCHASTHCGSQGEIRFFCAAIHDGTLLDCAMSLFPLNRRGVRHFLITFRQGRAHAPQPPQRSLEGLRGAVASLRAASETLARHGDMEADERERFMAVVHDEGEAIAAHMRAVASERHDLAASHWVLTDLHSSDLIATLARRLKSGDGPRLREIGEPLWLQADAPALLMALEPMLRAVAVLARATTIEAEALLGDRRVYLDFLWPGTPLAAGDVESWRTPLLEETLERHGCEPWSMPHRRAGYAMLRLPLFPSPRQWRGADTTIPERPEFYDFSLLEPFDQLGRRAGQALAGMNFVVFDTETTGLHPSQGDEIIAIAGVRIVNGRLLRGEAFERLVDPGRPIPAASTWIHGITEEEVQGQPGIGTVLPQFREFIGDAVLVAHNAAFDMRFLKLKEPECGVRFDNPVLDTLLLSVYLHSEVTDHTLDAIAKRLGVEVHGRHTALGDAIVTAEVFLKLLDLLATKGISSLGLAIGASEGMVRIRRQQTKAGY